MVPVVLQGGEHRPEAVEHPALDPLLVQALGVVLGEGQNAADVVVEDPDLHPLLHLLPQDVVDGVPHDPLLEDEKLQKDVPPGLFQSRTSAANTASPGEK